MRRQRRFRRSHSASRLGSELSAVINRVRSAFGSISMRVPAARPEIQNAEKVVDQTRRGRFEHLVSGVAPIRE